MEIGERGNLCKVLGLEATATVSEIKAAFQKLVTEFHASGKPGNIDDVEWLRRVVHAFHSLTEDPAPQRVQLGYDPQQIRDLQRSVENVIALRRNYVIESVVGRELAAIITGILS